MMMTIERENRRRFGALHLGMLAYGFDMWKAADPNVCFATSAMGARAEGDEDKEEPEKEEEEKGSSIPTKCASCGIENPKGGHFCMGCGESMSTEPEEPPPSSKKPEEKKAARAVAPVKMSADATLATILGATGESPLALKTAAIGLRHVRDTAAGVTGQSTPGAIVGTLLTMPERLATADAAVADAKKAAVATERTQRRDLASRLNKLSLDAWPRDAIFADAIDPATSKPVSPPPLTKTIAAWDLQEFRGYVEGFERKARPKTPFAATSASAQAGAREHAERETAGAGGAPLLGDGGEPTAAQIAIAKKNPSVIKMFGDMMARGTVATLPDGKSLLDVLAAQHVKTCAAMGAPIGGA